MKQTLFVLCLAWAAWSQIPHQHHPPQSAEEYAKILTDPSRDEWQKPHEVITALALKPGDTVADIGAGNGYFARRFARHAAKVYAVDIDRGLLEMAAKGAPDNLAGRTDRYHRFPEETAARGAAAGDEAVRGTDHKRVEAGRFQPHP